jgi:hypothetical protein
MVVVTMMMMAVVVVVGVSLIQEANNVELSTTSLPVPFHNRQVFYGNSLFSADVTAAMGTKPTLRSNTVTNLWIQLMAMPGACGVGRSLSIDNSWLKFE